MAEGEAAGAAGQAAPAARPERGAEIYTHDSPWPIYAAAWSARQQRRASACAFRDSPRLAALASASGSPRARCGCCRAALCSSAKRLTRSQERQDRRFRIAVGSFLEEYGNRVDILDETDGGGFKVDPALSFPHPYPPTKLQFIPDREGARDDLLASTADFLRIWHVGPEGVTQRALLNNNKTSEFCAPLTSFDWNSVEPRRLATSSIDTTCTVWDVEAGVVDTQLIAHDREVYDIAWGGAAVFASVSADGSVRVFDLRDKEHSTIIYEAPQPDTPLLRLAWNKVNPRYMATIMIDSNKVVVLDIRFPTLPVAELQRHCGAINALAWAPHSACHICSAGDDTQALIWDLSGQAGGLAEAGEGMDPILAYSAGAEINQLQWSAAQPDWIAIAFGNKLRALRV